MELQQDQARQIEGRPVADIRRELDAARKTIRDRVAAIELAMNEELDELAHRPGWLQRLLGR